MINAITNTAYKNVLNSSLELFNRALRKCLKLSIEKVLNELFYNAEYAKTNQQELELFEQYNQLRKSKDSLISYLNNSCQRMPVEFTQQIKVSKDVFKLSLVDDSELEISLALNQIESTISSKFIKQLFVLEKRINVLYRKDNLTKSNMPMGSNSICWILKNTLNESSLSLETKSSLLNALRTDLRDHFESYYQKINDVFIEANILPNIQFKSKKAKSKTKKKEDNKKESLENKIINKDSSKSTSKTSINPTHANKMVNSIFEMMDKGRVSSEKQTTKIENKVLDKSLSELSNKSISCKNLDNLKEVLLETIQSDTGIFSPSFSKYQENSIDMMGHFYKHVNKDSNLDNNITASLDAINIPLIRTAISDQEFFNNEEHPAREYLEKLIHTSQHWHGSSVISDLEKFSVNIANEFDGSQQPFIEANENIDDYLQVTERRSKNAEKKHINTAKGKEKLQNSRLTVHKAIENLSSKDSPKFVQDVTQTIVKDSLTLGLLRHGEDSEHWNEQLSVYSDLIAMTQADKKGAVSPKQKIEALHHLDMTMDELGFSKNDRSQTIQNFRECSQSVDSDQIKIQKINSIQQAIQQDVLIHENAQQELTNDEKIELTKFKLFSFGTMFDFTNELPNEVIRRKLSWFSPLSNKALFVSMAGRKPYECTMNDVAIGMHNKSIIKVDSDSKKYFNNFLSKLLNKFKGLK